MSLALHYWMTGAHHCSGPPPAVCEMTYTVSIGTLNSTIPYLLTDCLQRDGTRDPEITWSHVWLSWINQLCRIRIFYLMFETNWMKLFEIKPKPKFDSRTSHWYCREGPLAKVAPVLPEKSRFARWYIRSLEWGSAWCVKKLNRCRKDFLVVQLNGFMCSVCPLYLFVLVSNN